MVSLRIWVGLGFHVIPKWTSQELKGPRRLLPLLKVNTLNGHGQADLHLSQPISFPRG